MKISELNLQDRPREKILKNGPQSLTDVELLALLLRTGVRGASALELARTLLSFAGESFSIMKEMSVETLSGLRGMGGVKALTIAAAFELGRRAACEGALNRRRVSNPADAAGMFIARKNPGEKEECFCIFLKRNKAPIEIFSVSSGSFNLTDMDVKKIVGRAMEVKASAVIVGHNHPSGNPRPSKADVRLTEKLRQALNTFELALVDHIIISPGGCYSFSQDELFDIEG